MTDTYEPSELDLLKQRADDMGISYSPNIGLETLRERVNAKLATQVENTPQSAVERHNQLRQDAMKLVRVRLTCLNPSKGEYEAEYFRAGNRIIPTVCRLVPFEKETHIEQILLDHIKDRKYAHVRSFKKDGNDAFEHSLRNEFQIEILPPLTQEELDTLAAEQAKRQTV